MPKTIFTYLVAVFAVIHTHTTANYITIHLIAEQKPRTTKKARLTNESLKAN